MRRKTHVRPYHRKKTGATGVGGDVTDHDRGFEGADGLKAAVKASEGGLVSSMRERLDEMMNPPAPVATPFEPVDFESQEFEPTEFQKEDDVRFEQPEGEPAGEPEPVPEVLVSESDLAALSTDDLLILYDETYHSILNQGILEVELEQLVNIRNELRQREGE